MPFLKKLGLWLTLMLFSGAISLFTFTFIATQTVGKPEVIKSWLADSNTYENFINLAADKIDEKKENQQNLISQEDFKKAALASFTPELAQDWAETVLDGTFGWLNKESSTPEFVVDYSPQVDTFIDSLTASAESKYLALPQCQSISDARATENDPLNATCQVPGVNITEVQDRFKQDLRGEDGLFEKTTFTQDDLKIDPESSFFDGFGGGSKEISEAEQAIIDARKVPFYEQYPDAPDYFSKIKSVPLVSLIVALVSVIPIIFLANTKIKGARRVGWRLISGSIVGILGAVGLFFGTKILTGASAAEDADEVKVIVVPFVNEILKDFVLYSIIVSAVLLIIGVVIIVLTRGDRHAVTQAKMPKIN